MPHPEARRARAIPSLNEIKAAKRQRIAMGVFMTLAALATYPLILMLTGADRLTLVSTCPPVSGTHLALVAATTHSGESSTFYTGTLAVFDIVHGRLVAEHGLGTWDDTSARAICLGAARPGAVWMRRGDPQTLEMRDGRTGAVTVPFEAIVRKNPLLSVGVLSLGWDADHGAPTMSLRDGHNLLIDPTTLETSRYEGTVSLNPFGVRADEIVRSQSVSYYVGGLPGLLLADGRRITLEGHPRPYMLVDGQRLFGERDFYMPSLHVNPATGRVEWPDPPSLIVVEETLVGSLRYRVTRIGLDGRVLYTVDPGEALPAGWIYRPNPWTVAANGTRLLHFGERGFIGLDTATGREMYRVAYDGEPLARDED